MGKAIKKSDNALIKKRRKKRFIKRIILLFTFLISMLVMLCLKHPLFNISNIKTEHNNIVSSDELINLSGIYKGNNIFYINTSKSIKGILKNPYILNVKVERKLPNTIIISVEERDAVYYGKKDNSFLVIDKTGIVLEEKADIKNMKLIELIGFDYSKAEVGKKISAADSRQLDFIESLVGVLKNDKKFMDGITSVDASDLYSFKIYYGNICIKLGGPEDLDKKLNTAVNIMDRDEFKQAVKGGYIDVGYDGNPVYFIEK
ncbi:MAG: cell division protein FtsQ/DivIB [Solirubrobacterales bacterium]